VNAIWIAIDASTHSRRPKPRVRLAVPLWAGRIWCKSRSRPAGSTRPSAPGAEPVR